MKVVIIPYRDRAPQLKVLLPRLKPHFDKIIICEQASGLPFNRGGCKHAGVAFANLERDDTLYFHDVDLLPMAQFKTYPLVPKNTVIHLYGHRHCLGGIVGMQVATYKTLHGFDTHLWQWGGEDTALQKRAEHSGIRIDRSQFTLRFQNDAVVQELDDAGSPMRGTLARQYFLDAYKHHKEAPPLKVEHQLQVVGTGLLHDSADGVMHCVCR